MPESVLDERDFERTQESVFTGKVSRVRTVLHFDKYIGLPYWPETNTLIDIGKDVNPRLGPARKDAALKAALEAHNVGEAEYQRLIKRSQRPFYTIPDSDEGDGEIIIPEHKFQSFLNHCSMEAPRVIPRIPAKGLTFVGVRVQEGYFRTGKTKNDAKLFSRFVKMETSNQRCWSEHKYIEDFDATGTLTV